MSSALTTHCPSHRPWLALGLFLLAMTAARAEVSDLIPTTVSGGTGAVSDIQADDGLFYSAAKGNTIAIGGFAAVGGDISSVVLHVKFTVQSGGYSGSNPIRVNGVDTGIVPANGDSQRTASVDITAGSFRIDTWPEITALAVSFQNNDVGQSQSVHFDHVHLVVTHATPLYAPPTWSDEFDDSGPPNPSFWTFEQGFVRNEELQWYQQNAWQENGALIIEGRREQVLNPNYNAGSSDWKQNRQYADYTSASIKSDGKVSFQYGRMQVRARIPCFTGSWPAIWTLGDTGEWPSNGECDVMEYYLSGGQPNLLANCARGTTTRWSAAWDTGKKPVSNFTAVDPAWETRFHVWTMQWDQDNVRLYVDNTLMNTTPQSWLVNPVTTWGPAEPFKQPHFILLNLAIGANGGNPAGTTFPLRYLVDYVRVWEGYTDNVAPNDIALSSGSVNAGLPAGTVVGSLSATDSDAAEIHAFSLVSGTGSTHNASFEIVWSSGETKSAILRTKEILSASGGATRSIRVRVTDIEGATYDKVMTVNVISSGNLVIYNGNGNTGGSVPVDGNGYADGATVTVLGNTGGLTKSAFTFTGWNTAADGSGTSSAPGATFTIGSSDVTLYAKWQPDTPPAGAIVYTGANGSSGTDTWNTSANWNTGSGPVPTGAANVEIAAGKTPWAVNATQPYTGNLTLRSNATLGIGVTAANNTANALGASTNAGTITMEGGSKIIMRYGAAYTFNQNIALTGAATIQLSESTNGHNVARTFASPITGAYDFTLLGQNGNVANLNAANSFTSITASVGGTSNNWKVSANAVAALGTGDVTIHNAVNLVIGQPNAMESSRALRLNGVRSSKVTGENKLVLNAGLTVTEFWLDGVQMAAGTYNSSSGLLDSGGSPLISGAGTLTVTGVTGPGPIDHFAISPIASPQTVGTPITGITITARDASNNTAAGFTGTVTFGGTGGFSGTSVSFTGGVLSGVSVTPTVAGSDLTLSVDDGGGHTGSAVITTILSIYDAWASSPFANPFTDATPGGNPDGDSLNNLLEFAFGTDPTVSSGGSIAYVPGGDVTSAGSPVAVNFAAGGGEDFRAVFVRRKDCVAAGLTYTVQFSTDLASWVDGTTAPTVLTGAESSGDIEAVSVPYPLLIPTASGTGKPTFFRVAVSQAAP